MAPIKNDSIQHVTEQLFSFSIDTSFARQNEGGYPDRHLPEIDSSYKTAPPKDVESFVTILPEFSTT
jgi:hypothetical protein